MKTRMELWKDYRKEIQESMNLFEIVKKTNPKFNLLYKRLLKVIPNFEDELISKNVDFKYEVVESSKVVKHSKDDIKKIDNLLHNFEYQPTNKVDGIQNIINNLGHLHKTIEEIKNGNIRNFTYFSQNNESKIKIGEFKFVTLGANMKNLKIAIDGPSGVGKSTIARLIANKYGLTYINTGLVYRAFAFYLINKKLNENDETDIKKALANIKLELLKNEIVIVNEHDVTSKLKSNVVSQMASKVATNKDVREWAQIIQQNYCSKPGVITEGRDTTFKVMPDADIKIFLDTKPEIRAKRRLEENKKMGFNDNYEYILNEIKERDERDKTRKIDPLHQVEDAFYIDASELDIEEVKNQIEKIIENKVNQGG